MNDETIMKRRSCRVFSEKSVDKETEDRLLEMTLRAPSGGNMQLWSLIRVKDQGKKEALSRTCDNQPFIAKAPLVYVFLSDTHKFERWFEISGSEGKTGIPNREPGIGDFHLGMQDAVAAAQTCVLAAETLGLGSCYIGDIIENYEEVRQILNLPDHASPACMLVLGWPGSKPTAPLLPRPDAEAFVFDDEYPEITGELMNKMYSKQQDFLRGRKVIPEDWTYADNYYRKKYTSDFMKEMNRSAEVFLAPWLEKK